MADLFLGIDAGSSVLKAAVFDTTGRQISVASERTPLQRPHQGWVEADPQTCLNALDAVVTQATKGHESAIRAIGIAGAMVGAWLVDSNGKALRPGINWEDSRSQDVLDAMVAERPSLMSDIFAVSGSVLQQGCTLPVLAWFKLNKPDDLAQTEHVLTYKDFLRHHLTGTFAADRSEAAVLPGDARSQSRSQPLMDMFGITDLAPLMPDVSASQDVVGHLTSEAAQSTGLQAGIPVVAGAGDVIANVIGAGGLKAGAATAILGTTCMVGVCHDEPVFMPPDLGLLFSLPDQNWYRAMVNVAGTLNLDWTLKLVAPDLKDDPDQFAQVNAMVANVPIGSNGVTYLPYLSESGIIAPIADPHARAQFCGLHAGHDRADLVRAVYEGVAFAIADLVDLLSIDPERPITLTGGGSHSAVWCQMIADVTGRSILVPEGSEFGAKGAALLAATAFGTFASVTEASQATLTTGTLTRPKTTAYRSWTDARERFAQFRNALLN
ncbi:MAG: FGGY-family carbohydrate kinase [Hyphomicrobiales bacterium]